MLSSLLCTCGETKPQELKSVISIVIKFIIFAKLVTVASRIFVSLWTDTGTLHKRVLPYSEANIYLEGKSKMILWTEWWKKDFLAWRSVRSHKLKDVYRMQIMTTHAGISHKKVDGVYFLEKKKKRTSKLRKEILNRCSSFKTRDFGEAYYKRCCRILRKAKLVACN